MIVVLPVTFILARLRSRLDPSQRGERHYMRTIEYAARYIHHDIERLPFKVRARFQVQCCQPCVLRTGLKRL